MVFINDFPNLHPPLKSLTYARDYFSIWQELREKASQAPVRMPSRSNNGEVNKIYSSRSL